MGRLHWMGLALCLSTLPACAASQASPVAPPAREERPGDVLERGGKVGLTSFALAGRVTWQSLKTVGGGVRGLFTGGARGARRGWDAGADRTREVARSEAERVRLANSR